MNLFAMVVGLFKQDLTEQTDEARQVGAQHGEAVASAYCDGFFSTATEVFQRRLAEFQSSHIEVIPTKRIKQRG